MEERRRVVEETFRPGMSVAEVGRRHGINANQIFTWLKQYLAGKLGSGTGVAAESGFISVEVVAETASADPASSSGDAARREPIKNGTKNAAVSHFPWAVEIELPCGIKARFLPDADASIIRRILSVAREFA